MRMPRFRTLKKGVTAAAIAAASLGGVAMVASPASANGLCKCELAEGPFKTWIMLDNQAVALFDCRTGEIVATVDMVTPCNSIVTKPDCSTVFVGTVGNPDINKPPSICDIDCETLEVFDRPIPAPPIPNGLICKDNLIIVMMEGGLVGVLNCDTGDFRLLTVGGGCNSLIAKCFGNQIFVGTTGDPATGKAPGFCDIDCMTLEVIERPLPAPPVPNGFWLSPDDRFLWIMLQDFSVVVFDCVNGQLLAQIPVAGGCNSIKGKCDGSRIFVGTVGGDVPQVFFPPVGFGQGAPADKAGVTGGNFTVDSFFDITYQIEIDIPGQPPKLFGQDNPLRGNGMVRRGNPQRDFSNPGSHATIPIEMIAMNLQGQAPDGGFVEMVVRPEFPGGGQAVGGQDVFQGDFPIQPVDSFFDIFYEIRLSSPTGEGAVFIPEIPIRHELDPEGPPLTTVPFGCDWWRVPQQPGLGIPLFQDPNNFNPNFPPQIFVRCDLICFPPPPPPKEPGVCDIPFGTFIPLECDLPAPPIPCGIELDVLTGNLWVAMQNGTVGVWDCNWNPIFPDIMVGGGCTTIDFKPDFSTIFVGTAGNPALMKPPGICDIDPTTFQVMETPTPGVPQPKGIEICPIPATVCPGDCDGNGIVNFNDLVAMLFVFGQPGGGGPCDANGDGVINFNDLVRALFLFGPCP
ncbi:MAG: hypothetical protein RLN60_01755 [Phycisphaerales bacterium]